MYGLPRIRNGRVSGTAMPALAARRWASSSTHHIPRVLPTRELCHAQDAGLVPHRCLRPCSAKGMYRARKAGTTSAHSRGDPRHPNVARSGGWQPVVHARRLLAAPPERVTVDEGLAGGGANAQSPQAGFHHSPSRKSHSRRRPGPSRFTSRPHIFPALSSDPAPSVRRGIQKVPNVERFARDIAGQRPGTQDRDRNAKTSAPCGPRLLILRRGENFA